MPRLIDANALKDSVKETYCDVCNSYNRVKCRACNLDDAMSLIDDAPTVPTFGEWVSVKDRSPENGQNILVASAKTGTQYVSHKDLIYFDPDGNACVPTSYLQTFVFTHWAPLPEPPKEDKDDA